MQHALSCHLFVGWIAFKIVLGHGNNLSIFHASHMHMVGLSFIMYKLTTIETSILFHRSHLDGPNNQVPMVGHQYHVTWG